MECIVSDSLRKSASSEPRSNSWPSLLSLRGQPSETPGPGAAAPISPLDAACERISIWFLSQISRAGYPRRAGRKAKEPKKVTNLIVVQMKPIFSVSQIQYIPSGRNLNEPIIGRILLSHLVPLNISIVISWDVYQETAQIEMEKTREFRKQPSTRL